MNRRRILTACLVVVVLGAGCGDDGAPAPTAGPTTPDATTAPEADPVLLEVAGVDGTVALTMTDLRALPVTEGWGGGLSSTGTVTVPELHRGVALVELAALVGGLGADSAVEVTARDGYSITFSNDQVADGDFVAYDPGTGEETEPDSLIAIVAYERSGGPIPEADGPLRLAVVSPDRDQVVDGHWTVKWVTTVRLAEAAADWVVSLAGDGAEEIDRPTFDSCLACHSAEWTDGDGRLWAGVPLYLIAGRIDGGDTHGEDAYDAARAETGYSLEVVAADGFTGEIPSSLFHLRETVLLAATLDGEPLGDDGPLRVVGPGLTGRQQVARVVEIAAVFAGDQDDTSDEGNAAPSDAVPPPGAALAIGGLVDQALDLDADGLAAFEVVEVSIEHPKDGERAYVGIPIAHLLTAAGPAGGAATLTVVAGDGYSAEVGLAELAACEACLLAFDGDVLSMALSGFSGSAWVGDVVAFEIS